MLVTIAAFFSLGRVGCCGGIIAGLGGDPRDGEPSTQGQGPETDEPGLARGPGLGLGIAQGLGLGMGLAQGLGLGLGDASKRKKSRFVNDAAGGGQGQGQRTKEEQMQEERRNAELR